MMKKMKFLLLVCIATLGQFISQGQTKITISGKVTSAKGTIIQDATLEILNTGYNGQTDKNGQYSIDILKGGQFQLAFAAQGFATTVQTISITKSTTVDIILQPNFQQLDEIVVTAEKSDAKNSNVPMAVYVLNARQVNNYRLWDVNQLTGVIPNLSAGNSGDGRNVTSIRGITTTSYEQAVATYVDGVNQFTLDNYMPQLFDVERIEVLRGPQGTLYGRNAMGGVINIITKKPTNKQESYTEFSMGNYNQSRLMQSVRFPIIKNKLFFGAAALMENRKGFYTNNFTKTDFDGQKRFSGNYYMRFIPNQKWEFQGNFKHSNGLNNGAFTLAPSKKSAFDKPFTVNQNATTTMQDDNINASLSIKHRNNGLIFSSQTSFQHNYRIYRNPIDADFSPLDAITIQNNYGKNYNKSDVFTEELRVQSEDNANKPFKWTVGSFFFAQNTPTKQATQFGKDAALLGMPDINFSLISVNNGKASGGALFGQTSYQLSKKLSLVAGLRLDAEKRTLSVAGTYYKTASINFPTRPDTSASRNFTAFSPKAGIQYHIKDNMEMYLMYTRGYRAGGLTSLGSDPSQLPLTDFQPEYSNNIEWGLKSTLINNTLMANIYLFTSFLNNVQQPTLLLPDAVTVIRNAGKLQSKGAEMELSIIPVKGLELNFNSGFVNATYTALSIPDNGTMVNLKGNHQIFTPAYTQQISAQYSLNIVPNKNIRALARVEWLTLGKQYFDPANSIAQEAYTLVNMKAGIQSPTWNIYGWARNLANTKYISYGYDFGGVCLGNPLTAGVTLGVKL
jgi:iron complex outermembrane receptor protein